MSFTQEPEEKWKLGNTIFFRFVFSYFVLYILLIFLQHFLETPLRWFATNILHWGEDFEMHSTGSGDMTTHYVVLGFTIVLALLFGTVWTIMERKRRSYHKLFHWFQIILRVLLLFSMLLYGFAKIFKGQFPDPSLERLLQPVGDMSPMGLAWTFMGHSLVYNIFIGFAEVLGGVLMLYRKTVTLGSLIIIGVMTNVAMMNFTYDIPVKLLSVHLVLIAMILLLADRKRVMNFFFRNKTAEKVVHRFNFKNKTLVKLISIGKILILAIVVIAVAVQSLVQFEAQDQLKMKSEFYGIWETQLFVKNNDTLPPLLTDSYRWRYLILDQKRKAVVKKMNDSLDRYIFEANSELHEIVIRRASDSIPQWFSYNFLDAQQLQLRGAVDGDSLFIRFKQKPESSFRLINREFHWVNEYPYNK